MKTLTLEYLAPYLPYRLKARIEDFKCDYVGREFDLIIGFHQWDKSGKLWSVLTEGGAKPSIDKIKPILRPLSDLTKIENLEYKYLGKVNFANAFKVDEKPCGIMALPHYFYIWLLSGHYDVFGLIEQGLAIDINTIENE